MIAALQLLGFPQSMPPLKPARISTIPANVCARVPLSLIYCQSQRWHPTVRDTLTKGFPVPNGADYHPAELGHALPCLIPPAKNVSSRLSGNLSALALVLVRLLGSSSLISFSWSRTTLLSSPRSPTVTPSLFAEYTLSTPALVLRIFSPTYLLRDFPFPCLPNRSRGTALIVTQDKACQSIKSRVVRLFSPSFILRPASWRHSSPSSAVFRFLHCVLLVPKSSLSLINAIISACCQQIASETLLSPKLS